MTIALAATSFDPTAVLTDEASRPEYLRQSFASGDPADIAQGLVTVAPAVGMGQIASEAGLARPAPSRALAEDGTSGLPTLARVLATMGLRPSVERAKP